jgi:hypothetical protein
VFRLGFSHRATFAFVATMASYVVFHGLVLTGPMGRGAIRDDGWVSWLTMAFQLANLALIANAARRASARSARITLLVLSYIALMYLLREADFHRLFTAEHVTRDKFYTDASIPFWQRTVAATILWPVFVCLLAMLARYSLPIARALLAGQPWALCLVLWGFALLGSQVTDQAFHGSYTARVVEESLEASAAGLALLTTLHVRANPAALLRYTTPPRWLRGWRRQPSERLPANDR